MPRVSYKLQSIIGFIDSYMFKYSILNFQKILIFIQKSEKSKVKNPGFLFTAVKSESKGTSVKHYTGKNVIP